MNKYPETIRFLVFLTLLLTIRYAEAQVVLSNIEFNAKILKYKKQIALTKGSKSQKSETIYTSLTDLPFFDDFSQNEIFPNGSRWIDNDVFINSSYPDSPPSIGAATFDAINGSGAMYDNADTDPFSADKLTSLPFDLSKYTISDNIYLSFFYQPQGKGDPPDDGDSLILEFYMPGADSGIFINEFLTDSSVHADEYGENEDWIEIFNASDTAVDIGGYYITKNMNAPFYRIPDSTNSTIIPPFDYKVLYADNTVSQGPLHVNFTLTDSDTLLALIKIQNPQDSVVIQKDTTSITIKTDTFTVITTDTTCFYGTDTVCFYSPDTIRITDADTFYLQSIDTLMVFNEDSMQVSSNDSVFMNSMDTVYFISKDTLRVSSDTLFTVEYDTIPVVVGDTVILDKITFSSVMPSFSYGRTSDGAPSFSAFIAPTPGYANSGWERIWATDSSLNKPFQQEILPLESQYLIKGFRFRFRNTASFTSNNQIPTFRSNCDHWHLDYVFFDKNRSAGDTIYNDLTFTEPECSFIIDYESIPCAHFITNSEINPKDYDIDEGKFSMFNHDSIYRKFTSKVDFIDYSGGNDTITNDAFGVMDIPPYTDSTFTYNHNYNWGTSSADSAVIQITSYFINSETDFYTGNDTTSYFQRFYDYYAYDDGSAEYGTGLRGDGAKYGKIAMKFYPIIEDTLQGVQMYFNQTMDEATAELYFWLTVWRSSNGRPGDMIYKYVGYKPEFADDLNEFYYYKFDSTLIISDTFYIGIVQTTEDFINLGFEIGRASCRERVCHRV